MAAGRDVTDRRGRSRRGRGRCSNRGDASERVGAYPEMIVRRWASQASIAFCFSGK